MQTNQQQLVPALRFPEFEGQWEVKKLGNIADKVGSGSTPSGGNKVYTNSGIPFIRSQNVTDDTLKMDDVCFIPEEIHQKMKNSTVKPNDILLNITGASIGRSCVVPENFDEANVNQHVCIIRLKKNYTPRFLQPFLSSHKGQALIYRGQTGSGREGINFASIRGFRITFPSLPEQQKIANFLSIIDKKKALLRELSQQLESFKKGLMQQLFSQQVRFLDENGEAFGDWEVKRLGKVANVSTGKSNREDSTLDGEYTFFDRSQDIRTSSRFLFEGEAIIVAGEGQTFLPKYFVGKFDLHQRTYCIMDFNDSIGKFIYYHITHHKAYFIRYAVGTTVKSLRLPIFNSMKIPFPTLPEQKKIAACLSLLDQRIQKLQAQLEAMEEYKRGLLQQLLV